jgi:hypothetical protein
MDQIILSRKDLYELVWQESMLSLSRRFNISDVGLRKMCIRMQIPVPPAGHWAKIQFGKKVKKPVLPSQFQKAETITLHMRDENNPAADRKSPSPRKMKIDDLKNDISISLNVPEKLVNPDPLIAKTKVILAGQIPDKYNYLGTVSSSREGLNIRVAKENVRRALLFFDALIKVFKARGHAVEFRNNKTIALISGHDFELFLREKMRKETLQDKIFTRQVFHPTGILILQVDGWYGREFKDGITRLEDQLAKIIVGLESLAVQRTEWQVAVKKAEEEREDKERMAKVLEERKNRELLKFKTMLIDAERSRKTENLRRYIHLMEVNTAMRQSPDIKEWLEWAKRKADWFDPFIESYDELLDDVDRNILEFPKKTHW